MKKYILILASFFCVAALFGQAKKPTLMVVPSDAWCNQNQYMTSYDNQGTTVRIPDYKMALQSSPDLLLAISKINDLMADRGFPLKNMETVLKNIEQRTAEDNLTTSKAGSELAESLLDKLSRTAKADIILQLTWTVNENGPKKSVTYNLQGLDASTGKQIAGAQGTGSPSFSADVPVLLEEAVLANMDNFTSRLQSYFEDLFANGREVLVDVRVFDNGSGLDLEKEYDGMELGEVIDQWMHQNTVSHRFSKLNASENKIEYEQVRIPLFSSSNMAMDAEAFVKSLQKYLRAEPFKITSKVMPKGLGRAVLILGEK